VIGADQLTSDVEEAREEGDEVSLASHRVDKDLEAIELARQASRPMEGGRFGVGRRCR
jgi:hypothetical protein